MYRHQRTRMLPHNAVMVALLTLGVWVRVSSVTVPLECHREEQYPDGGGESTGNVPASSFIVCQLRLLEEDARRNPSRQYDLDERCLSGISNENGLFPTTCLSGTLHVTTIMANEAVGTSAGISPPSMASNVEDENEADAPSATVPSSRTIMVGRATYHPPYSQHGRRVEVVLDRAPPEHIGHDKPPSCSRTGLTGIFS